MNGILHKCYYVQWTPSEAIRNYLIQNKARILEHFMNNLEMDDTAFSGFINALCSQKDRLVALTTSHSKKTTYDATLTINGYNITFPFTPVPLALKCSPKRRWFE